MVNVTSWRGRLGRIRAVGAAVVVSACVTTLGLVSPPAAVAANPSFRVLDTTVAETDADRVVCAKVRLSRVPTRRTTVSWATANGTATAPSDYTAKSGTLVFPRNTARTRNVCTTLKGDLLNEPTEHFRIRLSGAGGATIADRVAEVTVTDNDSAPALTAGNATQVTEGNAGVTAMTFPVSLSSPSAQQVSVGYAFGPGSPPAGAGADFTVTPQSGTLTFAPGDQQEQLTVQVLGDTADEVDEQVALTLANAVNGTIADGTGVGTIRDDDGPGIAINNVSKNEGWLSGNPYTFTVNLSAPSPQTVTVGYSTAGGSATSGNDFVGQGGTLTFLPGQTAKTVTVAVAGDLAVEGHETFFVNLGSPSNATIADGQGVGTIINDDATSTDEGIGAAMTIGALSGDTGSGQLVRSDSILLGDADWYRVELNENNTDLFSSHDLTARINLDVADSPAQTHGDLDLQVFRANGTLVGSASAGGTNDETFHVKKFDNAFVMDHTVFFVKVFGFGNNQINNYTLRVNGNVATGVAPNL
jgi:hypothetical protein